MKWYRPQWGETRTLRRFAWLPVWDWKTVFWLEWVVIHQERGVGRWITTKIYGKDDHDGDN